MSINPPSPRKAQPRKKWLTGAEINGIPEAPDKYDVKLADGIVIGDADKPRVDAFLKEMHAAHAPAETVNAALNAYYKIIQNEQGDVSIKDDSFRTESETALKTEWGADFKKNLTLIQGLLSSAPEGVADKLISGRTADGNIIGNDPAVMKWLSGLAVK